MKQKNQKIGTFSRTKDCSGDVGEQKHGEEWKNSSENDNTFLAAVTSSKDVHAMHKSSKKHIFTKIFRKSSQFGRAFSRKNVKRLRSPHKNRKCRAEFFTYGKQLSMKWKIKRTFLDPIF